MRGILGFMDALCLRPGVVFGTMSFQAVGGSTGAMAKTTWAGSLAKYVQSITYAATGVYTVQMVPGFGFPAANRPIIELSNGCADVSGTNSFYAVVTGVPTFTQALGISFVIQCLSAATTPFAPPNTAGNLINFSIEGVNETSF